MEIRSLEIDFDTNVLKINGKEVRDFPVIVTLPGLKGYPFRKLFNPELAVGKKEECNTLEIRYSENLRINSKP